MKQQQPVEPTPAVVPQLLRVEQVLARLGIKYSKFYTLVRNEGFPRVRFGEGEVRVSESSLEQWLETHGEVLMRAKKELYPRTPVERAKRSWPSATSRTKQEQEAKKPPVAPAEMSQLIKVKDVMRILQIGEPTVYRLIHSGELPAVRIACKSQVRYRVRPEALAKWIAEHEEVL